MYTDNSLSIVLLNGFNTVKIKCEMTAAGSQHGRFGPLKYLIFHQPYLNLAPVARVYLLPACFLKADHKAFVVGMEQLRCPSIESL
jgi:hypothetical protein